MLILENHIAWIRRESGQQTISMYACLPLCLNARILTVSLYRRHTRSVLVPTCPLRRSHRYPLDHLLDHQVNRLFTLLRFVS